MTANEPPTLLTPEQVAPWGFTTTQLAFWRKQGGGPAFYRIGKKVLYSPADLNAFVESCRIEANAR